jgi:nicotinamidase-related amidase
MLSNFACPVSKTALVILDMQRYFTEPQHAFARATSSLVEGGIDQYFSRIEQEVIPNIQSLLMIFRQNVWPVHYTEFGSYLPDGADMPSWARRLNDFSRTTFGSPMFPSFEETNARIDDRIKPQNGEPILRKTTTGAVASSSLELNLRARGITHVIITGVVTAFCVSQTARELADRDFDVAIVSNGCASFTEAGHAAALTAFGGAYGWVQSTERIIQLLTVS